MPLSSASIEPKPYASFDVDQTIAPDALISVAIDACIKAGLFSPEPFSEASTTLDHIKRRIKDCGDISEGLRQAHSRRLVIAFAHQAAGLEVDQLRAVTDPALHHYQSKKSPFVGALMGALTVSHEIIIISESPAIFLEPFLAESVQSSNIFGSDLEVQANKFTGRRTPTPEKDSILDRLVMLGRVVSYGSVAIGDSINDGPMLGYTHNSGGHPIMFNPTDTLEDYGLEFGWSEVKEHSDGRVSISVYKPASGSRHQITIRDFTASLQTAPNFPYAQQV